VELENVKGTTIFQFGSVTNIPFDDDFFDFINMSYVFHEVIDKHKALNEIKRVLKQGGMFYLTEFHRNSILAIIINGIYILIFKGHKYWLDLL
jgi:ubiquinone/menaquinone biosynthesis C-methylase UbiE